MITQAVPRVATSCVIRPISVLGVQHPGFDGGVEIWKRLASATIALRWSS
jgi:hypothetical protein